MDPVSKAYMALGFIPLDEFMTHQHRANLSRIIFPDTDTYRGIGATTWMQVTAIARAQQGGNIMLVAPTMHRAKLLLDMAWHLADQLTYVPAGTGAQFRIGNGMIYVGTQADVPSQTRGRIPPTVYSDDEWKARAIRRIQGPYAMIREIRWEAGQYAAYAEDNEYLMNLTADGAYQASQNDPTIISIGWWPDLKADPHPVHLPAMRGALSAAGTPVHRDMVFRPPQGDRKRLVKRR